MDTSLFIKRYIKCCKTFTAAAHDILGMHETSPSRIVILDDAYRNLDILSVKQDELIRQGLRCLENKLYRAAHVMVWSAMIDFIEELILKAGMKKLKNIRPNWSFSSIEDIRENYPEYQIIQAGKDLELYSKNFCKAIQGLLNKRNECAHPSNYYPGLNESLGYISEIINRIKTLTIK